MDEFYRITFTLPSDICGVPVTTPNSYRLSLKIFADNLVYKVYVNNTGIPAWTNPVVAANYNSNDNHSSLGAGKSITLNSGWQPGSNTIYVHVRSGAPGGEGWTGFMCTVDVSNSTSANPCGNGDEGCCLGNECGAAQNPLAADYEVPMNNKSFYFSGDKQLSDKLNVGLSCANPFPGKLNVVTNVPSDIRSGNDSYSIYGENRNQTDGSTNTGVYGLTVSANGEGGNNNERGVWGVSMSGIDGRGVFGQAGLGFRNTGGYLSLCCVSLGIEYGVTPNIAAESLAGGPGKFSNELLNGSYAA